jgi:hypothetical protein
MCVAKGFSPLNSSFVFAGIGFVGRIIFNSIDANACLSYEYSSPQIIKIFIPVFSIIRICLCKGTQFSRGNTAVHLYAVLLRKKPQAVNDNIFVIVSFEQGLPFKYGGSKELCVILGKQWHEPIKLILSLLLSFNYWSTTTTTAGRRATPTKAEKVF